MKKNQKQSTFIWKTAFVIFGIGLAVCLGLMAVRMYKQKQQEKYYESLLPLEVQTEETESLAEETEKEDVTEETETEEKDTSALFGIEVPEKNIDFGQLKEQNKDVYAWVYVPGTNVDYPVLQHESDDSYYLNHNMDNSSGLPGCIYTESVNAKDFTDPNTVLYGHNMKNGSMFASLHKFEDKQVFDENRYIYIYTEEKTYVYEIFAAYKYNAIHLIYNFDLDNPEIFQNYLEQIFAIRDMTANINQDISVNSQNHIITLSTCVSGEKNMRYLVQGVLLNEE